MKAVIQRVSHASVSISGQVTGEIGQGLCVLLGIAEGDKETDRRVLLEKLVHLRIFSDEQGKMNRSLMEVGGKVLLISQFTLLADCRKGRRPSFLKAGDPGKAKAMYESCIESLEEMGVLVEHGTFGADMQVELCNDGPVTICLDSKELMS